MSAPIKLSNEHDEYKYFDPKSLPDKVAYKHHQAIDDWLNLARF